MNSLQCRHPRGGIASESRGIRVHGIPVPFPVGLGDGVWAPDRTTWHGFGKVTGNEVNKNRRNTHIHNESEGNSRLAEPVGAKG
jgi:hypothetical protein